VSIALFFISISGIFITRQNIILILICIELMLLSVNLNFVTFSVYLDDIVGQLLSLILLAMAGTEASIGLAILIIFYRIRGVIGSVHMNALKG
jgi:NADH:ubiquinone oxidoreductase subunit K